MKPSKKPASAAPAQRAKLKTASISLRVSVAHLAELDQLERRDGVQRSAQIQRAISEYLERRRG